MGSESMARLDAALTQSICQDIYNIDKLSGDAEAHPRLVKAVMALQTSAAAARERCEKAATRAEGAALIQLNEALLAASRIVEQAMRRRSPDKT